MSRELITKYPEIFKYSTIWMEMFTHKTAKGESKFMLTNTNKLLKVNKSVSYTHLKNIEKITKITIYCFFQKPQ